MKKFITFVIVLVILAAGAAFAVSRLVPVDLIELKAKEQFTQLTGRDIAYTDRKMTFWPSIGLRLREVTVSNPPWAQERHMLQLDALDIRLALRPLLDRRIEVSRFVLEKPVLHLETSPRGEKSWDMTRPGEIALPGAEDKGSDGGGRNALRDFTFRLGEFEFKDGTVTYRDGRSGVTRQAEDIDITVMLPDLESAMQMDGAFTYNQKRVNLVLHVDKPADFLDGKGSTGAASVKTDVLSAKVKGRFATAGTMLDGDIDAAVSSVEGLLTWLGDGEARTAPFKTVSFKSGAVATASTFRIEGAGIMLDDIQGAGNASVDFGGSRPALFARLSVGKLNLDRFAGGASPAGGGQAGGGPAVQEKSGAWDTAPIDFSGLHALDADLILQTKGYSLKGAEVGPSNLTVVLKNGRLDARSSEAELFGGKFSSDLAVTAAATPTMAFKFKMAGVQAKPILTTFVGFEKLSGSVDADVNVTSSGASQKAIVEGMNGGGAVTFRNGSLQGIDLVNIAKMIQNKLSDMSIGEGKTDFVELGGTFTVTKGVAHNSDLRMKGPLVQATGSGSIDLPKKYVQYRLLPVLTASSAVEGAGGITVPVDIKGPFSNIKVKPDYKSVIKNVIENPEDVKKTLKGVEDQIEPLKDDLKNFKKDPAKALESLLGRGLLGPRPAPSPAPAPELPQDSAP